MTYPTSETMINIKGKENGKTIMSVSISYTLYY